jgi:hypothetical protein
MLRLRGASPAPDIVGTIATSLLAPKRRRLVEAIYSRRAHGAPLGARASLSGSPARDSVIIRRCPCARQRSCERWEFFQCA